MSVKGNIGILVAEPQPAVRDIIGKILDDNGYKNVRFASKHGEIMDILHARETDLALLDFKLATDDTFALIDDIVLDEHLYRLPMVLMGNKAPIGLIDEAMRLGARDYINKPFTPYLLMVRLEKIIFGQPKPVRKRKAKAGEEAEALELAGGDPSAVAASGELVEVEPPESVRRQQDMAKRLFLDGHRLLKQKYHDKAMKKFAAAARVNTLFPEAYKALAEVFRQLGDHDRSSQFLSKAAETHAWLGQEKEAVQAFNLSRKLDPKAPNPFKTVGDHMAGSMHAREVSHAYERAVELTPKEPGVRVALSRSYMETGQREKAAETLRPMLGKGEIPEDMQHVIMQVRPAGDRTTGGGRRQFLTVDAGGGPYEGKERRRAMRIPLAEYSARVPSRDDSFQVFDVSSVGISFKHGGQEFKPGDKLSFDLLTLDGVKAKKIRAVVRRLTPLVVGCDLLQLSPKQKAALDKVLPEKQDA